MKVAPLEPISTAVGYAAWDDHAHFGHAVFRDLAGTTSLSGLMALASSGLRLGVAECGVLDDIAVTTSIAEPRIWPLKVTRLVASFGRTIPGAIVGDLSYESRAVGPWTFGESAQNWVELQCAGGDLDDARLAPVVLAWLERKGRLAGFGVPFRPFDERVVAFEACIARRGRTHLPYWRLYERTVAILRREKGLEVNIGGASAAAMLDLGLAPEHISPLAYALMQNILLANAVEGARQASPILQRLPPEYVTYIGVGPRVSPRAERAQRQTNLTSDAPSAVASARSSRSP